MNHPGSFDPIAIHIHIQLTGFSFPTIKINDYTLHRIERFEIEMNLTSKLEHEN
jgi:hypothetical protein